MSVSTAQRITGLTPDQPAMVHTDGRVAHAGCVTSKEEDAA